MRSCQLYSSSKEPTVFLRCKDKRHLSLLIWELCERTKCIRFRWVGCTGRLLNVMVDQSMAGVVGSRFANVANSVSDLTISWCLLVEKDVEDFCWVQCSYANAAMVIFDGKALRAQKMWFEWENKHCTILRWARKIETFPLVIERNHWRKNNDMTNCDRTLCNNICLLQNLYK